MKMEVYIYIIYISSIRNKGAEGAEKIAIRSTCSKLRHGADLVKHMTLWSRFKRARAWEALQHSFFHVDPEDKKTLPEFATMQQRPIQPVAELEQFVNHEDDYLFDRVPSWIDDEPMDPFSDMYWYHDEVVNYILDLNSDYGKFGYDLCDDYDDLWLGHASGFLPSLPKRRCRSNTEGGGTLCNCTRALPQKSLERHFAVPS